MRESTPEINIDLISELKRGYLIFRAYENALGVANKLQRADQEISQKHKEASNLASQIEKDTAAHKEAMQKMQAELEQLYEKRKAEVDVMINEENEILSETQQATVLAKDELKSLEIKLAAMKKEAKKREENLVQLENRVSEAEKHLEDIKERFKAI